MPSAHAYALLVPRGLEAEALAQLAADGLVGVPTAARPGTAPKGYVLGAAGSVSAYTVRTDAPLPASVLSSPVLAGAAALVLAAHVDATAATAAALVPALAAADVDVALHTLAAHRALPAAPRFRVATERGGKHAAAVTSMAVSAAVADALVDPPASPCGGWAVDLKSPESLTVVVTLAHEALLVGFMLPPFASKRALPPSPRAWLPAASRQRPHMSPCRAACLVRLCRPRPGERFLDPCGGLGIIAIEAALAVPGLAAAVTIDIDPEATALAADHAERAGAAGVVRAVSGDALALDGAGADYDCVCVDLPYGSRHPRLDVAKLLKSVAGVLRPGGRALLVDSARDGAAVRRSVARQAKAWAPVAERFFDMAGIEAVAFELRRV